MKNLILNLMVLITITLYSCEKDVVIDENYYDEIKTTSPTDSIAECDKDSSINIVGCYYPIYE